MPFSDARRTRATGSRSVAQRPRWLELLRSRPKTAAGLLFGLVFLITLCLYLTRPADVTVADTEELFPELDGFETAAPQSPIAESTSPDETSQPASELDLANSFEPSLLPAAPLEQRPVQPADFRPGDNQESATIAVWLTGTIEEIEDALPARVAAPETGPNFGRPF